MFEIFTWKHENETNSCFVAETFIIGERPYTVPGLATLLKPSSVLHYICISSNTESQKNSS